MTATTRLTDFFFREIEAEERGGFPRLSRIPASEVMGKLDYYRSLNDEERQACLDYCAHRACAYYGFVIGLPVIDHRVHPFFQRWETSGRPSSNPQRSVPLLRAAVGQYKTDAKLGVESSISQENFEFASSIRSVKAAELRKRIRVALLPLGYNKLDELGYYCCRFEGREFRVGIDYGGRNAQMRYCVAMPEFEDIHPLNQFCFERALGFGNGDWDFIIEENVDNVIALFSDIVRYCVALPDRIRTDTT